MAKIDINMAAEIMKKHRVDASALRACVEEFNIVTQPDSEEKPPVIKKQFVGIISDPEGKLPKFDLIGWIVQIPENESPHSTLDRVKRGAYDFNASKRGRMLPAASIGETFENAGKYLKEADVWIKTKTPVQFIVTDNVLPKGPKSE